MPKCAYVLKRPPLWINAFNTSVHCLVGWQSHNIQNQIFLWAFHMNFVARSIPFAVLVTDGKLIAGSFSWSRDFAFVTSIPAPGKVGLGGGNCQVHEKTTSTVKLPVTKQWFYERNRRRLVCESCTFTLSLKKNFTMYNICINIL